MFGGGYGWPLRGYQIRVSPGGAITTLLEVQGPRHFSRPLYPGTAAVAGPCHFPDAPRTSLNGSLPKLGFA
ncbi:hypothetical protein VFPFJ_08141 [Purpureocillium lilacinum]|uniref:Uncharacterized protein n=1 Tax=Purpureocillium lilacinum TaxID=33203 RepID=A0A179GH89_PURLI|nr:hypothetical protein VFPFJ_08141 [Purpureocillium lilacinum]OAQ77234.1 hypothetical protein VFPBJ_07706 [Purpureocillium lilacinum]OAQ85752.1 hypothetical protein VFPFJ_08141 [Purpureocillium lilacinum]